jgi:hypothetical protein
MNSRIEQLALQATDDILGVKVLDKKKFAELIVQECMTICEDVTERNEPAVACYYEIKRQLT